MKTYSYFHFSNQDGLTLLETLVALLILALGLLGLAGLQVKTLQSNQESYVRGIASDLANNLADRIRANHSPFLPADDSTASTYPLPPDYAEVVSNCSVSGTTATCSAAGSTHNSATTGNAIAISDVSAWYNDVLNTLPNSSIALASTAQYTDTAAHVRGWKYTLTITWRDDRVKNTDLSYSVVIQ